MQSIVRRSLSILLIKSAMLNHWNILTYLQLFSLIAFFKYYIETLCSVYVCSSVNLIFSFVYLLYLLYLYAILWLNALYNVLC